MVTPELVWALSDDCKQALMQALWEYMVTGTRDRPSSWTKLLLTAIQKLAGATDLDDYRVLALVSFLGKWLMRVATMTLQAFVPTSLYPEVLVYGFTASYSTTDVSALIRQAMWISTVWGRDLVVTSADVYK